MKGLSLLNLLRIELVECACPNHTCLKWFMALHVTLAGCHSPLMSTQQEKHGETP